MDLFIDKVLPSILTSICLALFTWLVAYIQGFLAEKRIKKLEERIKRLEELHKHDTEVLDTIIKQCGFLEEGDIEWALTNQLIGIYINEGLDKDIAEAKARERARMMTKSLNSKK